MSSLADLAMLMAVSTLSPVSTQSLISALASSWIVSGTPSWNRSSMAVAPTISKSCSISAAASANLPFRSSVPPSRPRAAFQELVLLRSRDVAAPEHQGSQTNSTELLQAVILAQAGRPRSV